mmetsp:Transcript_1136/g.2483  ORF Transcript_1136/g.2483 Transcript_1136/m.2483 type:complete len:218 (+) Transcript_1136:2933-3586(+)
MAVPPGHEAHLFSLEHLVPVDEVLENLIQRVPDVQVSVGVRRAIVQREHLGVTLGNGLVHLVVGPILLNHRLLSHGVGTHLKVSLGQKHRVPIHTGLLLGLHFLSAAAGALRLAVGGGGGGQHAAMARGCCPMGSREMERTAAGGGRAVVHGEGGGARTGAGASDGRTRIRGEKARGVDARHPAERPGGCHHLCPRLSWSLSSRWLWLICRRRADGS